MKVIPIVAVEVETAAVETTETVADVIAVETTETVAVEIDASFELSR